MAKTEEVDLAADPTERVEGGMKQYWAEKNLYSMDGLPGLTSAYDTTVPLRSIPPPPSKPAAGTAVNPGPDKARNYSPMPFAVVGFVVGSLLTAAIIRLQG